VINRTKKTRSGGALDKEMRGRRGLKISSQGTDRKDVSENRMRGKGKQGPETIDIKRERA